jgi:hypothetical protein
MQFSHSKGTHEGGRVAFQLTLASLNEESRMMYEQLRTMNPAQICEEHRKQIAVLAEQFRVMNNYANPCKDDAVDAIRNSASMIGMKEDVIDVKLEVPKLREEVDRFCYHESRRASLLFISEEISHLEKEMKALKSGAVFKDTLIEEKYGITNRHHLSACLSLLYWIKQSIIGRKNAHRGDWTHSAGKRITHTKCYPVLRYITYLLQSAPLMVIKIINKDMSNG